MDKRKKAPKKKFNKGTKKACDNSADKKEKHLDKKSSCGKQYKFFVVKPYMEWCQSSYSPVLFQGCGSRLNTLES